MLFTIPVLTFLLDSTRRQECSLYVYDSTTYYCIVKKSSGIRIHFTENTTPRVANAFVCILKHERLPAITFTVTRVAITLIVKKVSTLRTNIFSINQNLFINFVGHTLVTSPLVVVIGWIGFNTPLV